MFHVSFSHHAKKMHDKKPFPKTFSKTFFLLMPLLSAFFIDFSKDHSTIISQLTFELFCLVFSYKTSMRSLTFQLKSHSTFFSKSFHAKN